MKFGELIVLMLLIYGFWGCVWGAVTYQVAKSRGYTGSLNFWLGFLLGLIGLVIILVRPEKSTELGYYPPAGQLDAYQGRQWFCTRCGTPNAATNTCVGCGERYWFCTICGTPNSFMTPTCGRCGYVGVNGSYVNAGEPQAQVPVQQQYQSQPQSQMQVTNEYADYTPYYGPDDLIK